MSREQQRAMRDPLAVCRVVGDVVDPFTRCVSLRVLYGDREVANGAGFRPSAVASQPTVLIDGEGDDAHGSYYTLSSLANISCKVLVDPDSPSPSNPTRREYLHWLVTGINPASNDAGFGQELVAYEAPRPSAGIHRLVFVLFRHAGGQVVCGPAWRENFSTRAFADLNGLGAPVAVMYYNCQREKGAGGRRFM